MVFCPENQNIRGQPMLFPTAHAHPSGAVARRIKEEIVALTEEQMKAIQSATFAGMPPEESQRSDERCRRISELIDELEVLRGSRDKAA
jgi:hypothetical protein